MVLCITWCSELLPSLEQHGSCTSSINYAYIGFMRARAARQKDDIISVGGEEVWLGMSLRLIVYEGQAGLVGGGV